MFGFGNGRLVSEVASGTFNLVSLLDIAGIGQPPRFWRDPYVLGYLFGTATMLVAIGSNFKLHGEAGGALVAKAFREFSGPRADQVMSDLRRCLETSDPTFLEAARKSTEIVSYVHGIALRNESVELIFAMNKRRDVAVKIDDDISEKNIRTQVYHAYLQDNWIGVIRERFATV